MEHLSLIAIADRAYDITMVQAVQKARVQAFLGQEKYEKALQEAKGYYNVVTLQTTDDALKLLTEILEKHKGREIAERFKFEQIQASAAPPTTQPRVGHSDNVLSSIKVDPSIHAVAIEGLQGRTSSKGLYSYGNRMACGNLLLLLDRAADARRCFEEACHADDIKVGRNLREAVEGIARAIRAHPDGSVAKANAFIASIRNTPELMEANLAASLSKDDLRAAAQQTILAPERARVLPPLELERIAEEKQLNPGTTPIRGFTNFESAIPMRGRLISANHVELSFNTNVSGATWFIFQAENVNGKIVRFDVKSPIQPLDKWISFNPVYSYVTDLADPDSFTTKTLSSPRPPVAAWNGNGAHLPDTSGEKWHYVPEVWQVDANTMAFVLKFESDKAYVAMRVPYTPSFNERFLKSLSSNPSAQLIEIGKSQKGKPLLLLQIGSNDDESKRIKPCILVYGGEHPDEQDSMWAAHGAIEYLLGPSDEAKALKDRFTFLVIPMVDPDASSLGRHVGIISGYGLERRSAECTTYANWFQKWINAGNQLNVVFNFHNVQSVESGHVACALMEELGERGELSLSQHKALVKNFRDTSMTVSPYPWERGWSPNRLGGWLARSYGPLCLCYEVNAQAADRHLSLKELKGLGATFVRGAGEFLSTADGAKLRANIQARRHERSQRLAGTRGGPEAPDAIAAEAKIWAANAGSASALTEKLVP